MDLFKYLTVTVGLFMLTITTVIAQDDVFNSNIHTARLYAAGNQLSMPVYNLNSGDKLYLSFDDMDGDVKMYYYTYQLCDINWQPVDMSQFDYLTGFTQAQIQNYKFSYLTTARYTHYQIALPEASSLPTRSGNYLVKVFLDGDTSKLAFTRRMLVVDSKATVAAQILQPFGQQFKTHQRLAFTVNIGSVNSFNTSQEIKVVVMQNYRWDNIQGNVVPTFIRGNNLEYNSDNIFVFPGGKEWRWLDLRSFSLQSDRVKNAKYKIDGTDVYLQKDVDRSALPYTYYVDYNGLYFVATLDNISPGTQADYATVHFSYATPTQQPYPDKDVYLFGQLTDYKLNDSTKLKYNVQKNQYEINKYLKQGYYNYDYVLVDKKDPTLITYTNGDHFETENNYTILVYYKSFTDQTDQLIGISNINSRNNNAGNNIQ
ncbi:MAG TPA: DUF5103 domain-containing protein [Ferruginibacter sp.]|jgi:hypothetical protein|nr:DUF5103 domain-containing protein [Ferruginibacter sp.]